jgi:hypothetical protein
VINILIGYGAKSPIFDIILWREHFMHKKVHLSFDGPTFLKNDRSPLEVNKICHPNKLNMLYMMASVVFPNSKPILSILMFN